MIQLLLRHLGKNRRTWEASVLAAALCLGSFGCKGFAPQYTQRRGPWSDTDLLEGLRALRSRSDWDKTNKLRIMISTDENGNDTQTAEWLQNQLAQAGWNVSPKIERTPVFPLESGWVLMVQKARSQGEQALIDERKRELIGALGKANPDHPKIREELAGSDESAPLKLVVYSPGS